MRGKSEEKPQTSAIRGIPRNPPSCIQIQACLQKQASVWK